MKKMQKKKQLVFKTSTWFIIISMIGVGITIISLLISHGDIFSKIFFADSKDTGMDFFHSIEYTKARSPYILYGTLYPPLANLLFYILFRFVPEWQFINWTHNFSDSVVLRATANDLRVWQPTMVLFIAFLIISAVLLIFMVQKHFEKTEVKNVNMIAISALLSYGVLYGYERGNIIIIAMLCTMFFVCYKDSENPVLSELALIMLAFGAGLKIYPALFGMLLLYDKQYAKATRTIVYGIVFFVLPMFVFHDGLQGFVIFFTKLLKRSGVSSFSLRGYSFDNIINALVTAFSRLFGYTINEEFWMTVIPKWNLISAAIILIEGFYLKKKWQKALVCTVAICLYSDQGIYGTMFFLIPLLNLLKEEPVITKTNILPFITLVSFVVLLPIMDSEKAIFSYTYGRYQLCMLVSMGYLTYLAWAVLKKKNTAKK